MPELVVMGAMTKCSFGLAPSSLMVLPVNRTMCGGLPAANIMDSVPDENVLPFGMCISMANPEVAAATAAAFGVLVPMPCEPITPEPWMPGSPTVLVAKMPALTNTCMLTCMWGGEISILVPGQFQAMAP